MNIVFLQSILIPNNLKIYYSWKQKMLVYKKQYKSCFLFKNNQDPFSPFLRSLRHSIRDVRETILLLFANRVPLFLHNMAGTIV